MSRGQLVPDDTIVRDAPRPARRPRRGRRRDPRRLPAEPRPRPRRSTTRSQTAGRRVARALYIDVPIEDLVQRMAEPPDLPAQRSRLQHGLEPAAGRRPVCDIDGSALIQRADDTETTVRARMAEQVPPLLDVVDHYRRPASCRRSTDGRHRLGHGESGRGARCPGRRREAGLTWSPASRVPRSSACAAPGASSARSSTSIEAELKPGVSTADLDAPRRGAHPGARAAMPVVQGLPGDQPARGRSRPACASRIDRRDRPRHPGRPHDPRRPDRVGRRRRHRRRLARRRGPDLLRRRAAGGRRPS